MGFVSLFLSSKKNYVRSVSSFHQLLLTIMEKNMSTVSKTALPVLILNGEFYPRQFFSHHKFENFKKFHGEVVVLLADAGL